MTLDDALEALFAVPVDEFLAKRTELVAKLREAGDRQAAMAVKTRAKPTLAAHALNQVPRVAGDELDRLFAAGRKLASGKDFKDALEEQRAALDAVRAKLPLAHATELVNVLRGAMADEALATLVREGRFSKIPEVSVGFFGAAPTGGPRLQVVQGGKGGESAPARGRASTSAPAPAKKKVAHDAPPAPRMKTMAERHAEEAKARAAEKAEKAARERAERKARELAEAEKELKTLTAAADEAERVAAHARRLAKTAADRVAAMRERS